ncbi:TRAP transporter large permease [Sulfitobacter sp. 1A13191]|uniref:TRAP transporter large permease n=1 Tax=unclassified Sulfitobacter TaxID=196795 RepID=UPI0037454179|tara:strand:- start:454 stop:1731 length:1278 start_codon:yes stop_codon:yes gene_type:complete
MIWLGSTFALTLLMGIPIAFVLGLSAFGYFLATDNLRFLVAVPQRMFAGQDSFILLAIPLFILAGSLMDVGGLTQRLVAFANALVGRFRGGLSLTAIWGSFLFGGVSGSAAADAAALGTVLSPDLKRQGYNEDYSAALIGVSSIMAPLVPPSIAMILYGALSGTSISRLFVAGIVPGVLLAFILSAYAVWIAGRKGYPKLEPVKLREIMRRLGECAPVLLLPVIIIGGIRGGVVTPTEAAAVAVVYALLVAGLWYKALSLSRLRRVFLSSALLSATIYLLIGFAHVLSLVFAIERLPQAVVSTLSAISENKWVILIMVNLILLVLGMFLDTVGILILTVPALMAIGNQLGLDPVHLGVIVVFNCLIGFATPPVGLCLYVMAGVTKRPIERISIHALPMVGLAIVVLAIITIFPGLVLFLPNLLVN